MSGVQPHRSVTPAIEFLKTVVRGRPQKTNALRFIDTEAARTQPQPNLPGGPYAKTTGIYYYARDARREVEPPTIIAQAQQITGHFYRNYKK